MARTHGPESSDPQVEAGFLDAVRAQGIDERDVTRAAEAVMCALERRVSRHEAERLDRALPDALRRVVQRCEIHRAAEGHLVHKGEFVEDVAEHLGTSSGSAECFVVAVFKAAQLVLAADDVQRVAHELPPDLRALWSPAPSPPAEPRSLRRHATIPPHGRAPEAFLMEIATRGLPANTTPEEAFSAVLCSLEQRLSGGLFARLEAQIPSRLRDLLRRCEPHPTAKAEAFGKGEFLRRVAGYLNVAPDEAEEVARVVFASLRRLLSSQRLFRDVAGQLPADLADLWQADRRLSGAESL